MAFGGMSSARCRLRTTMCLFASAQGAKVKPQLPITTLVMPCQQDEVPRGSQKICASMWVCPSTKPGATTCPSASITSWAPSLMRPIVTTRPSPHAHVGAIARQAGSVDYHPVLDHEVIGHRPLLLRSVEGHPMRPRSFYFEPGSPVPGAKTRTARMRARIIRERACGDRAGDAAGVGGMGPVEPFPPSKTTTQRPRSGNGSPGDRYGVGGGQRTHSPGLCRVTRPPRVWSVCE